MCACLRVYPSLKYIVCLTKLFQELNRMMFAKCLAQALCIVRPWGYCSLSLPLV